MSNPVATENGYAIRWPNGTISGRVLRRSGGGAWALYKTKKAAENRAKSRFNGVGTVFRAKITITEEPTP